MAQVFLSDIDLFYSTVLQKELNQIKLIDDEFNHAVKVMRKTIDDNIFITNGNGNIFDTKIKSIEKKHLICSILKTYQYSNQFNNVTFCLPILKNKERQEFALEKCIELGFTNFIYYSSEKSFKSKLNLDRTNKIALAAMKQSLRSFHPKIEFIGELSNLGKYESDIIYFDQKGKNDFRKFLKSNFDLSKEIILVIGSESGFSETELKYLENQTSLKLAENRLRSETAVIYSAILLDSFIRTNS